MGSDERVGTADIIRRVEGHLQLLLAAIPLVMLVTMVGYLVSVADRGFDITDEGYYLLNARYPGMSTLAEVSSFGYYTGILYRLAGGEIFWFRILGVGFLLAAGGLFSVSVVRVINRQLDVADSNSMFLGKVSFIMVGGLLYYAWTIVTPSYNLLILAAILMSVGALLFGLEETLSRPPGSRMPLAWFGLAGLAIGLGVLSKASSALLLASTLLLTVLVWPGLDRGQRGKAAIALVAGGAAIGLLHALFFQAPLSYLDAVQLGIRSKGILDPRYGVGMISRVGAELTVLGRNVVDHYGWWYLLWPAVVILGGGLVEGQRRKARVVELLSVLGLGVALWASYRWGNYLDASGRFSQSVTYFSWAVLLIIAGVSAALVSIHRFRGMDRPRSIRLIIVLLLCLSMPVVFAFGTNNHILVGASTGVAPLFAAIVVGLSLMMKATGGRWAASLGMAGLAVIAAITVTTAGAKPYRLNGSLSAQVVDTDIGVPPTRLRLDSESHGFFVDMNRLATDCGFSPGDEIIDLSGRSPGVVFALGGRSPGTAWYAGGYPGSAEATSFWLSLVSQERRTRAWLLAAPGSTGGLEPAATLQPFGITFPGDFEHCGTVTWPLLKKDIQLWRPATRGQASNPSDSG